ncbi:MAG: hypothetical protein OEV06_12900 [Anaerolineae bacterium]|nr:hypothetical protein [Anaerolineae bacterium]
MDKIFQWIEEHQWLKYLIWISIVVLFGFSYISILELGEIANPARRAGILRVFSLFTSPDFSDGDYNRAVAESLWLTFQIAFVSTVISAIIAITLTYFWSRRSSAWERGLNYILQPILSTIRSIHPLFMMPPAVVLFSIGPTAGVIALTFSSTAFLTADFLEFSQLRRSLEWSSLLKLYFPGITLKRLPVNTMIATVLGFLGGGGIGSVLFQSLSLLNYRDASVALVGCIIIIGGLDMVCRAAWNRIQSQIA